MNNDINISAMFYNGIKIIENPLLRHSHEAVQIERTWWQRLTCRPLFKKYRWVYYEGKPYGMFIDDRTFVCHSLIYDAIKNGNIEELNVQIPIEKKLLRID
jgi:hypothetical protein